MPQSETGIDFHNDLPYTEEFNTYTYRNFYNGGGVALGDINNDGLLDIYFTGNLTSNKLYLNKGNWKFEDITQKAGVACDNVWSTGATMVDINGDDLLDIYVCKAGKPGGNNRHNELFINQGNLIFKESAKEYGLDITGLSIHAAFFDFDKDGDLDCYLLNNSLRSVGGFDLKKDQRLVPDVEGNKFMINDNGVFKDIANSAGIYSSNIGYGLGITLSDFNWDGWPDIFISNDFFERDYLYINKQDGTFMESAESYFQSLSMGSMGADAADIDNDLLPDLFVTEMLPATLERKKTKAQYEIWDKYASSVANGYHHQFSRNVLQRNLGQNKFAEIGRFAGVAATEWSWAALIQDFDNDGLKDLFISNGIYKDLLDKDYLNYYADENIIRSKIGKKEKVLIHLIDSMPSQAVENFAYRNLGNFHFANETKNWGLDQKSFSNGSSYGDLDNDGDLDLVVNNVNMPSFVYRNNTDSVVNKSIQVVLNGKDKNTKAIGAKVILKHKCGNQYIENFNARGFQSSIDFKIHAGVGNVNMIDTAIIIWPDDKVTIKTNLKTNQLYTFSQIDGSMIPINVVAQTTDLECEKSTIDFTHKELDLNLFARERMLTEMNGFDGPGIAVADLNQDNIEDVYCGGGKNQKSILFLSKNGKYEAITKPFEQDEKSEVVVSKFFDSDGDGDLDLYVGHGGKSFSEFAPELNDVLYINDGKGNFIKKQNFVNFPFPMSTGDVAIDDINGDKKPDIVVVEKMKTNFHGLPGDAFILYNQGNNNYTLDFPNALKHIGMMSDVEIIDVDADGWKDIVVAGKWMPIQIIYNEKGKFGISKKWITVPESNGLWNEMLATDIDNDGDTDIVAGNEGLNNFYSMDLTLFIQDFDGNGFQEQIFCEKHGEKYYPIHDIDEMFSQMPILKKKFVFYQKVASKDMNSLFGKNIVGKAIKLKLEELRSVLWLNDNGHFMKYVLPDEIQYASVHAFYRDNNTILVGGNMYKTKPQFGRQDA